MNGNISKIYDLSPLQTGMLFDALRSGQDGAYVNRVVVELAGSVDHVRLERALNRLVERHEALRTAFVAENVSRPVQVVLKRRPLELVRGENDAALGLGAPFDLERDPLLRAALVPRGSSRWDLMLTYHHIILDGWCLGMLFKELWTEYFGVAVAAGGSVEAPLQYSHYVGWIGRQDRAAAQRYWATYLADCRPVFSPPFLNLGVGTAAHRDEEYRLRLDEAKTAAIDRVAAELKVTRNAVVQAAWGLLLQRYGYSDDVVFGHVVSLRPPELPGIDSAVGLFINTIPIRVQQREGDTFARVVQRVQDDVVEGTQHGFLPWSEMVGALSPVMVQEATAHVYAYENNPGDHEMTVWGGTDLQLLAVRSAGRTPHRFTLVASGGKRLEVALKYNAQLIPADRIERLAQHLDRVLRTIVERPARSTAGLSLLDDDERNRLAIASVPSLERSETLQGIFRASARQHSARVAVTCQSTAGPVELTYAQLDLRSDAVAGALRSLGAGDQIVAVLMDRHPDAIVAMLGILKAGGAYLPIDPRTPTERIAFLLHDSRASVVLTSRRVTAVLPPGDARVLFVEELVGTGASAEEPSDPAALAYVIYTSGSTGQPKGVMVEHRNVVRLFRQCEPWFGFSAADVWSVFHSFAFDFSVWEIWGALLYGGRLVILSHDETRDPQLTWAALERAGVTMLSQTPSAFYQLLDAAEERSVVPARLCLRHVVFGGEALSVDRLGHWFKCFGEERPHLVNMYGITETTVHVTYRRIVVADLIREGRSPIGLPIPDLQTFVLDRHGNPVPPGCIGEIHVGGAGVARGYLNRPALTAARMREMPALTGRRLYLTGDLAAVNDDGSLEYLGRADDQVKIRGHRIELGEIEHAARRHPGVRAALARVPEDARGERVLQLCYVAADDLSPSALRGTLERLLPGYMVPTCFARIASLPLTANGKLDRSSRELPAPAVVVAVDTAPRNAVEEALAQVWAHGLGLAAIGIDDNFFSLGGDSIKSLQIRAKAAKIGLRFSVEDLFSQPTIRQLVTRCAGLAPAGPERPWGAPFAAIAEEERCALPPTVVDAYPVTALQAGMLFHTEVERGAGMYHDIGSWSIMLTFDEARFRQAVNEVVAAHAVLRTRFALTGFSRVLQLVEPAAEAPIEIFDLRSDAQPDAVIAAWVEGEKTRPFDLTRAPLCRFCVHLISGDRFQLNMAFHHAILDGWSVALLLTEMLERYLAPVGAAAVPAPAATFREFVALEQQTMESDTARAFWLGRLDGVDALTFRNLPPRFRAGATSGAGFQKVAVPRAVDAKLRALARENGLPYKSLLLAVHLKMLGAISGRRDLITGVVTNGRLETEDGDRVLGLFLNTMPLRLTLANESWLELAKRVTQEELAAFPHRRFPLASVQRETGIARLFEASFNFVHFHAYRQAHALAPGAYVGGSFFEHTNHALTTNWVVDASSGDLAVLLRYDCARFSDDQVKLMARVLSAALERFAAEPQACHQAGELLPADESAQVLAFGSGPYLAAATPTVLGLFRDAVARHPDHVAAEMPGRRITYRELDRWSARFAGQLQRRHKVDRGEIVGLRMTRSIEMLAAILGVLRAGAAYVPLSRELPDERLRYIVQDCGVGVIVTDQSRDAFPNYTGVLVTLDQVGDDEPEETDSSADLAYVIYTSGSTGRPKGCAIEHRSLHNYIAWACAQYIEADVQTWAFHSSLSYDLTVTSIFVPLATGRTIKILPEGETTELVRALDDATIDVIKLTPSHLRMVKELGRRKSQLKKIVVGGEELDRRLADAIIALYGGKLKIYNEYGPTEATVGCMIHLCAAADDTHGVPIGVPIWNTQIFALDPDRRLTPVGVTGELAIGGEGVARGYINRVELTHERFLSTTPGAGAQRIYLTGDLARWMPDGLMEFWGRNDDQVKLNGHRVELGEIEFCLARCPGVVDAAVLILHGRLHAFWRGEAELAEERLVEFASRQLPRHMVPRSFQRLAEFPIRASGKVDRARLGAMAIEPARAAEADTPPATPQEEAVLAVWKQVFGHAEIGTESRFLSLGGDSITALQISARLKELGYHVSQEAVLRNLTVREQAAAISGAGEAPPLDEPIGAVELTPIHCWFNEQAFPAPEHWNNSIMIALSERFDLAALYAALDALFEHHDGLRLARRSGEGLAVFTHEECVYSIESVDLRGREDAAVKIEAYANRLQGGIVLTQPPLARFALFHTDEADQLLLVFHHVLLDGVSWRVIVEDLLAGYRITAQGGEVRLPPKTASYRLWAGRLAHYATSAAALAEQPYWSAICRAPVVAVGKNVKRSAMYEKESVCLTEEQTAQLASSAVQDAYRTEIQDILVTALGLALGETLLRSWGGPHGSALRIFIENHGRRTSTDLDVSRTVGWFTCFFPFLLEWRDERIEATLVRVKEALRAVPNAGTGYGVLRYLTPLVPEERAPLAANADIIFNFWGNMERGITPGLFERSPYSTGLNSSPRNVTPFPMTITGSIVEGRLQMAFGFDPAVFPAALMQRLSGAFAQKLQDLITWTTRAEQSVPTPSDFDVEGLGLMDLALIRQRKG